jgi:hypothetical protein
VANEANILFARRLSVALSGNAEGTEGWPLSGGVADITNRGRHVITGVISRILNVPMKSLTADEARDHFGPLSMFVSEDMPASAIATSAQPTPNQDDHRHKFRSLRPIS